MGTTRQYRLTDESLYVKQPSLGDNKKIMAQEMPVPCRPIRETIEAVSQTQAEEVTVITIFENTQPCDPNNCPFSQRYCPSQFMWRDPSVTANDQIIVVFV